MQIVIRISLLFFGFFLANTVFSADTKSYCESTREMFAHCVKPSKTNSDIRKFDDDHWITFDYSVTVPHPPLLVFMPGTGGTPPGPKMYLEAAAKLGYRVISLAYNDDPAVVAYCVKIPDPTCSQNFRQMRAYGDSTISDDSIKNTVAESISVRLVSLLNYLNQKYPKDNWGEYLTGNEPNWARIALTGQSQGAGMAAYIAKQKSVARVILFSSPWDFYKDPEGKNQPAPWLSTPSITPLKKWFGGYHAQENAVKMLSIAYANLRIPANHVHVFSGALPTDGKVPSGNNPYHNQGIRNPDYLNDWKFFLTEDK